LSPEIGRRLVRGTATQLAVSVHKSLARKVSSVRSRGPATGLAFGVVARTLIVPARPPESSAGLRPAPR
jgi:hypothetical protein